MPIVTLGELRHECLQCGGICHGAMVRVSEQEAAQVREQAAVLGIDNPVVDGIIRRDNERCVFLLDDNRCAIHDRFGAAAKPGVCRQYPVVAVRVGDDVRVAVDPGCIMSHRTWNGPSIEPERLLATKVELPESSLPIEEAVLDLCNTPGRRLLEVLSVLTGEPLRNDALPAGYARRWAAHVRQTALAERIRNPQTAAPLRERLAHVADLLDTLDPKQLPPWRLGRDEEAFAVDAMTRMIFLRSLYFLGLPQAAALLVAGGAVLCAWADPAPDRFGPALSAWCRAVRAREVVEELLPDGAALAWIARGVRP